jgi:UDP-N-acetylglucosamine enolpyruvyl transferase
VCAESFCIISADQIECGNERIDDRLRVLGARITRVPPRVNWT